MEQKAKVQQTDSEFSRSSIPKDQRKSYISLTIVWTGYVFVITSMMAGGGLAEGLNFRDIILATISGNIFLSVLAVLVSIIACKTGLTFALLTRYSFGSSGSRLAAMFVPVINLGWYTIQAATYGHFIAKLFHLSNLGEGICMAVSAIVMGIFALRGIKAIAIFGYIAIPAIVFLSIATAIRAVGVMGGVQALLNYAPITEMELFSGITAVIGTWILSTATCIADVMRYAKDVKAAIGASLTGLLGGNILMIVCGAIAAMSMHDSDLTTVLLSFGLTFPSLLLMTTNIVSTNAANLYSTSLSVAGTFKVNRNVIFTVLLGISALATLTKPYQIDYLFVFLDTLGMIVPPLPGIIIADYYIVNKGSYSDFGATSFKKWNVFAWITWAVSIAFVYLIPAGLPSLNGLLAGVIIYSVLMKLSHMKMTEEVA